MVSVLATAVVVNFLVVFSSSSTTSQPQRGHEVTRSSPITSVITTTTGSTTTRRTQSPTAIGSTAQTPKGKCELFNDELARVCQPFRANRTIYVDARPEYSQSRIAEFMSKLVSSLSLITDTIPAPPQCATLLIEGICIYTMPDCQTDSWGKAIMPRLCKESCERIFKHRHLCHQLFVAASGSALVLANGLKFDAIHTNFSDFQCFGLPSQKSGSCYNELLNFPTLSPPTPRSTTNSSAVTPSIAKPQCEAKCAFPFTYQGIEYTECTTVALQYRNFRPWCMTNAANRQTWVNCNCTSTDDTVQVNGTCEMYSGEDACHSSRAGSVVFVDSRYNQSYLNAETRKVFEENNETLTKLLSPSCYDSLATLYCHLLYPDCLTVTKGSQNYFYPSPLCSEACFTGFGHKGSCASSYREAIAIYQLSFAKKSIAPLHMVSEALNCAQLPSSADSQCMMLKTPTSPESGLSTPVIVSIVLIVALVAALLSLIILLLHRRKRQRYDVNNGEMGPCHSNSSYGIPSIRISSSSSMKMALRKQGTSQRFLVNPEFTLKDFPEISLESIEYVRDLGEGAFGQVFLGSVGSFNSQNHRSNTLVAVKVLKEKRNGESESQKEEFLMELSILSQLRHPNIITLLAKCTEEEPNCMVLEYMSFGDLTGFLHSCKISVETKLQIDANDSGCGTDDEKPKYRHFVTINDLQRMLLQICHGLVYLAERRYVHRDMATRNCLVGEGLTVKISDFGLSRDIYANDYYRMKGMSPVPIRWMAPESIIYGKYTLKSDIWSLGVVIYEVFSLGMRPYYGMANEEVVKYVSSGGLLVPPDDCPPEYVAVMRECCVKEAEERPSAAKVVEMLSDSTTL